MIDNGFKLIDSTKIIILSQPSTFRVGVSGFSMSTGGCSTLTIKAMKKVQNSQIAEESEFTPLFITYK